MTKSQNRRRMILDSMDKEIRFVQDPLEKYALSEALKLIKDIFDGRIQETDFR